MWQYSQMSILGNSFLRKFIVLFIALSVSFLAYVSTTSTAHALEAGWDGDKVGVGDARYSKDTGTYPNVPSDSQVYSNKNEGDKIAKIVYFPAGAEI